jgi:hypothetical protein
MQKQAEVGVLRRASFLPDLRSLDEKARTIEFVASTEKVDRYGDVIRVAGWQLDSYKKNPVFMFAHKSSEPPIGKCVEIHTESNPPALVQTIQFANAATYPFAEVIFNLYRERMMNAVSVGFMPLEMPNRISDLENNTTGYEFTSQELLELSAVPIPANADCLARAVQKGFAEEDLKRAFGAMSAEEFYKELIAIYAGIADAAVTVARATVREAREALKAAGVRPESSGDLTLEEMLAVVKRAGTAVQEAPEPEIEGDEITEITSMAELATALGDGDAEFERSLGIDETETSWNGSRKWRDPGRLSKE